MLGSPQPPAWYMDIEQRPKEWSGDLLAEHPDSEKPSYLPGWLYEWMKRWMDGWIEQPLLWEKFLGLTSQVEAVGQP